MTQGGERSYGRREHFTKNTLNNKKLNRGKNFALILKKNSAKPLKSRQIKD